MRYGRAGSNQDAEAAIPETLATAAITGTMQHKEDAMAARTPAPINLLFDFVLMRLWFPTMIHS